MFRAHEQWNLPYSPDVVTFSKKMMTGGYYYKPHMRPRETYRIFNTWLGDPAKLLQLEAVTKTIKEEKLLENVRITGSYLLSGLEELQTRYPSLLCNARGQGTFCSIDAPTSALRDDMISRLKTKGAYVCVCERVVSHRHHHGSQELRLVPAATFRFASARR